MILTTVSVEGCGRFGTPIVLQGLGPGVNILAAGNEAGKSTIFRAIRTCLFERHSSTKEEIAALATEGLSLPVSISVAFEKDGKAYEIRKSFHRNKSASLSCDGVERWRNAEADEEVWKLLGIQPKSARMIDEAAYGILWVEQGRSFEMPEPSEAAKSELNALIQQEVGTLVGGERARSLLNSVNKELAINFTSSNQIKAKGPLDLAAKAEASLAKERKDAEERLEELRARIESLEELNRSYSTASDPVALQALESQFAEAERKFSEAEKAEATLKRLAAEERDAHELAEAQRAKLDSLTSLAEEIDSQRQKVKLLSGELELLIARQQDAGNAHEEAARQKADRDSGIEALDVREAALLRFESLNHKLASRLENKRRLALLDDFRERGAANKAALKTATVDAAALTELEAIEREEARIGAAMQAGAARVSIAAKSGASVSLNGVAAADGALHYVTETIAISVGSDVSITVSPPHAALDQSAKALAAERAKRAALLARHSVQTPAELRDRRSHRVKLEDEARDIQARRSALGVTEKFGEEIERLEAAIAETDAEERSVLPEGSPPPPSPGEIAAEKQALSERRNALRAERSSFEARIGICNKVLTELAGKIGDLRGQTAAINAQLASDLALLPDESREAMLAECAKELDARQDTHRIKAAVLELERAKALSPDQLEGLRIRKDRLSSALDARKKELIDLGERIAHLKGQIDIAGGSGLGEIAATLKVQHEMAKAETARLAERIEVQKLLRDTVQSCYDRRREQLNAPLRRHLKPFLNDVFPLAEIDLGENFAVQGLKRSGPAAELFGRLSHGTQEQVAVLVRLAMGAMICEKGPAVPVILDDALVFSDDDRIEQMFDAINRAGRNQQVIVLTCRARSFASLGGRTLHISGR